MIKKNRIFLVLFLALLMSGCADASNETKEATSLPGKFLVMRANGQEYNIYLIKKNREKKLLDSAGFPVWAPNGSKFLARESLGGKLLLIVAENGEVLNSLEWQNKLLATDWISNEKIISTDQEIVNKEWDSICKFYIYDFKTKAANLIHEFEPNQYVYNLKVSPDGKKVAFDAGPTIGKQKAKQQMGYIDLTENKVHDISPEYAVLGWFPDNKNIAIMTNTREDGSKYSSFGIIGKVDIESGKLEVIKELDGFYHQKTLSSDGKYFYYTGYINKKGQAVFVQALDSDEHYQVTFPESIPDKQDKFYQDVAASWYQ